MNSSYPNGPRTFAYWLAGASLLGAVVLGFVFQVPFMDGYIARASFNWALALSTLLGGRLVCAVFLAIAAVVDHQNDAFDLLTNCRKTMNDIANKLKK